MSVELPDDVFEAALCGLSMLITDRRRFGRGVPPEFVAAHRHMTIVSACGHESGCDEEQLDADDLIGVVEAALLLGFTPRHVRRIRNDLGGARPPGTRDYVFRRRSVIEYAQERERNAH